MMMKKTTSALAVAALLGTGAASAATFQVNDNTSFSLSGDLEAIYVDIKQNDGSSSDRIESGRGELDLSGEHVGDNGITSFWRMGISGFDLTDGNSDTDTADASTSVDALNQDAVAFIGIRGDFGSLRFGNVSNGYEAIADVTDIMFDYGIEGRGRGEQNQLVQYTSNDLNGFSFVVDAELQTSDEQAANESSTSLSGRVNYDLGAATLMAGYDERGNVTGADERIGVGISTAVNGFNVGAKYETADAVADADKFSVFGITAGRSFGDVTVYGLVNTLSYDAAPTIDDTAEQDDSFTQYGIGAYYSVTDTITAHVETVSADRLNDEGDYHSTGLTYNF